MAKRMIGFGSISQFREVVKNIYREVQYIGFDEETKESIIDTNAKMPILEFSVSEKSHGSNFGFSYNNTDKEWFQSRRNIITPERDNASSAFLARAKKEHWTSMIKSIAEFNNIDLNTYGIVLYAELQGGNVQKNAACSGLPKSFLIFQYCKVYKIEESEEFANYWIETKNKKGWVQSNENLIYNVMELNSFNFSIDFNNPNEYKNKMAEMIPDIEKNSIIGEKLGIKNNIGEGFVFQALFNGNLHRFKVKGDAHSKSSKKFRTLKPINNELQNKKIAFVNDIACTESRMKQAIYEVCDEINGKEASITQMGDVIRWVIKDTIKEESDILNDKGLEPKQINSLISKIVRPYFLNYLSSKDIFY